MNREQRRRAQKNGSDSANVMAQLAANVPEHVEITAKYDELDVKTVKELRVGDKITHEDRTYHILGIDRNTVAHAFLCKIHMDDPDYYQIIWSRIFNPEIRHISRADL